METDNILVEIDKSIDFCPACTARDHIDNIQESADEFGGFKKTDSTKGYIQFTCWNCGEHIQVDVEYYDTTEGVDCYEVKDIYSVSIC